MDWFHKYGEKIEFFELAQSKGVEVEALKSRPVFTDKEHFYWRAYSILSNAGYSDISRFCEDNRMSIDERQDLIDTLLDLRVHSGKLVKEK